MYLLCTTIEPTNLNFVNRELEQDPTSLDPICSVIYYQLTQNPANSNPFFFVSLESSCLQGSPALPTVKIYFEICHSYGKKIMCDSKKQKKQKKNKKHINVISAI